MEQQGPGGLCEEPREKHLSGLCGSWKDGWIPALWSVGKPLDLWPGFLSLAVWQAVGARLCLPPREPLGPQARHSGAAHV